MFPNCMNAGAHDLVAYAHFVCVRMEEKLQRGAKPAELGAYADEAVTAFGDGVTLAQLEERGVLS